MLNLLDTSYQLRDGTGVVVLDAKEDWLQVRDAGQRAVLAHGGNLSHHHGIGRMRVPWIARELGSGYPVLQALKRALDPDGLMNPGVLLPG